MRSTLKYPLLIIVFCIFSACASVKPEMTEAGCLKATISVPGGLDMKDVKECLARAFLARHFQNIEVADGKISGTYGSVKLFSGSLVLTAIYSATEIKLYAKGQPPDTREGDTRQYYPERWVEGVKKDAAAFMAQKALLEK